MQARGSKDPKAPTVTIVVPTRNERDNVAPLVARLEEAFADGEAEIVFVDDSDDETPAAVEAARAASSLEIRLIHRDAGDRAGGLGGAVVAGLEDARAPWVCVMDGDLQHPPELIPTLLETASSGDRDLVVASRYSQSGNAASFGVARSLLSKASTGAARIAFPLRLRAIHDPMSGFFVVRRDAVDVEALRPRGFKILLEIVARSGRLRTAEVPFSFGERHAGESKASLREGLVYLSQLARLRVAGSLPRFGLVGASGVLVNMLVFALLATLAGVNYLVAAVVATQFSTLSNFLLTEHWVFGGRTSSEGRKLRGFLFFGMNNATLFLRAPLLVVLVAALGVGELLANFLSLIALAAVRFAVADRVIWRRPAASLRVHSYNVHGIVSVQSEVALPELALFRVDELHERPTIRVRIGKLTKTQSGLIADLAFLARHTRYDEGLGKLGFGVEISMGKSTEVLASPLLRHSPHVLYTNVVEPIMRWTLVKKGYALVHAACVADGDDAYLITARTDTGKTTTILKMLDTRPFAFLSDDLTLLAPDGHVLTYPKPLTISRHTVAAVKTPLLTRWERVRLVYQSRLHSRSGRQFAMLLAQTGLPVATINAIVQLLVPPPKYHVDRLIPDVEVKHTATVKGMFVIERGHDTVERLEPVEAIETLLANSEDAFGFPPYPYIEHFLHSGNGRKLQNEERDVVASALASTHATVVGSATMDWYLRLPELMGLAPAPAEPAPLPALRLVEVD